ncbi:uncharacterized protein LOC114655154 [Erpetoichthys calabaricus]|uniref:uncharacterized protein LOC114655154 n=1 Tax=Erpetoichthys calabaricus TaxID=27687 RepID=UPI002234CEBE|nr:uncharacterized protein LOC114655154 [Erpetoichthys calabaricus]
MEKIDNTVSENTIDDMDSSETVCSQSLLITATSSTRADNGFQIYGQLDTSVICSKDLSDSTGEKLSFTKPDFSFVDLDSTSSNEIDFAKGNSVKNTPPVSSIQLPLHNLLVHYPLHTKNTPPEINESWEELENCQSNETLTFLMSLPSTYISDLEIDIQEHNNTILSNANDVELKELETFCQKILKSSSVTMDELSGTQLGVTFHECQTDTVENPVTGEVLENHLEMETEGVSFGTEPDSQTKEQQKLRFGKNNTCRPNKRMGRDTNINNRYNIFNY